MIYLIELPRCKYDESGKVIEYFQILKIGYTNDEESDINKNKRLMTYRSYYGSSMKLLKIIPNATEEQEKKLHYKFKDYLIEGNEWYFYEKGIIYYLNSVTLEELDNLPQTPLMVERDLIITKTITRDILSYVLDFENLDNYLEKIIDHIGILNLNEQSILDYLVERDINVSDYLIHKERVESKVYTDDLELNKEIINFFEGYDRLTHMGDKLRYLCEFSKKSPKILIDFILENLPKGNEIKISYLKLGPNRLYELGYNFTKIRKELGIVSFSPEVLINTIYSNFHVGDKIQASEAKEKLANLYKSISYKKSPMATDLEEFFEVKECKIPIIDENGNKKRARGCELIKSHELEMRIKLEQTNKN